MNILPVLEKLGEALDVVGVFIIVIGVVIVSIFFIKDWLDHSQSGYNAYTLYRQNLGRVILLGLEFLVAGDIIRSVVGTPTFTSVGVLAVIVLIRTFLSITFELEVNGRWPWQKKKSSE